MSVMEGKGPPSVSLVYDPRVRSWAYQIALAVIIVFLLWSAQQNVVENLRRASIPIGFGFLEVTSGFDVNQHLIDYSGASSTYGRAFVVGLLNTLLVGIIGVILATILGFVVGVARLSPNWIIAKFAKWYVEIIRNIPLLLQLVFWYNAVLKPLPDPRNSVAVPGLTFGTANLGPLAGFVVAIAAAFGVYKLADRLGGTAAYRLAGRIAGALIVAVGAWMFLGSIGVVRATEGGIVFLNNRGLYVPQPIFGLGAEIMGAVILVCIAAAIGFNSWASHVQKQTGRQYPVALVSLALVIGIPALVWIAMAAAGSNPITFAYATQSRFNLNGGLQIFPEFVALVFGLVTYTAAFIAEIVRAGILAVSKGQTEAANALGLRANPTMRLVVIPQAMRVIIPPLTSQYLNLVKNSSLAVAIGYPDLVQIFAGTVLNQTGQAVEVIAITMAVYLTISIVTSVLMNAYNRRVAIVER